MNRRLLLVAGAVASGLFLPTLAHAHPGHGDAGLFHGFMHPMTGTDHLLAMVLVGMIGAQIGGRAIYALPAAFIAMMVVGAGLGLSGFALPAVELGIAFSLIAFGLLLATRAGAGTAVATAVAGGFALFHGHAHGAEIPAGSGSLGYIAGFVAATAILHLAGIAISLAAGKSAQTSTVLPRVLGAISVLVGAASVAALS